MGRTKDAAKPAYCRQNRAWRARINGKRINLFKVTYEGEPPTEPPQEAMEAFYRLQTTLSANATSRGVEAPAHVSTGWTVANYAKNWLELVNDGAKANTEKNRRNAIRVLVEYVDATKSNLLLNDFDEDHAERLVKFQRKRGHKESTIKVRLKALSAMFSRAMKGKKKAYTEPDNPIAHALTLIKPPNKDPLAPENHYTIEEMTLIRERLAEYVKTRPRIAWISDFVTLLACTGMRGYAACQLEKSWLKTNRHGHAYISIPNAPGLKGGGDVICPTEVKAIIEASPSEKVFPKAIRTGRPAAILHAFYKREGKTDRRFDEFRKRGRYLHLWRHGFAVYQLERGVSLETVSNALSHKDLKTTKIYARQSTDRMLDELARLG